MKNINGIPASEIIQEPLSRIDPVGRLFYWQGKVYRGLRNNTNSSIELLDNPEIKSLFELGLVRTSKTNYSLQGYTQIINHEKIDFISYPVEWCSLMLRDAGLMTLNIQKELLKQGYYLKDGHPWNVLFSGTRPIFVDWGSIQKLEENNLKWFYKEFRYRFIYPLFLKWAGLDLFARYLFMDPTHYLNERVIFQATFNRTGFKDWVYFINIDRKVRKSINSNDNSNKIIDLLIAQISQVPLRYSKTNLTNYVGIREDTFIPNQNWKPKSLSVYKILQATKPKTVLDIGANKGWYSLLAESLGAKVIAVDIDETSISTLYQEGVKTKIGVLPLLLDICEPTIAHGPRGILRDARDRLACEMVLALAVSHHLFAKKRISFEQLALYLSEFSQKYLIVEFVTLDDIHIKTWDFSHIADYSTQGFIHALNKYFSKIEEFPSYPDSRVLLFCTK